MCVDAFHLAPFLDVDISRHREPDFTAALDAFCEIRHIDETLHVDLVLNQLDRLPADVRDDLLGLLLIAENLRHVGLGDLNHAGKRWRNGRAFRVRDRPGD